MKKVTPRAAAIILLVQCTELKHSIKNKKGKNSHVYKVKKTHVKLIRHPNLYDTAHLNLRIQLTQLFETYLR